MKFHFFGSLEGNKKNYKKIFKVLEKLGHESITNHVFERTIEDINKETPEESEMYVKKMLRWITKADVIIAEVTLEGISTGYEIMAAQQKGKPVIILYDVKKGKVPHTLRGLSMDKVQVYGYDPSKEETLWEILKIATDEAADQMDTRFNFFISPKHQHYLDWIAKNKKIPRSVFLRDLIDREINKDKDYLES